MAKLSPSSQQFYSCLPFNNSRSAFYYLTSQEYRMSLRSQHEKLLSISINKKDNCILIHSSEALSIGFCLHKFRYFSLVCKVSEINVMGAVMVRSTYSY